MKQKDFLEVIWLEYEQKTLYATGAFGAPLTQRNKDRYHVSAPVDPNTYLFDCVGAAVKAPLGGFCADPNAVYGGTRAHNVDGKLVYGDLNVPDVNETTMFNMCSEISTDFSHLDPCEAVWLPGHIGVYVGAGLVIESSPSWENGVQLTACNRNIEGFHRRDWQKHGKLPWVEYGEYIEPVMTYQTYDLPREKWQPLVTNLTDYAGVYGESVAGVRATPSIGKLEYWSRSDPENWRGGTYNGATSGTLKHAMIAFMARYDKSRVHYRVKAGGTWLPTVSGCDPGDAEHGYAGDDKNPIEAIYIWADPIFQEDEPAPPEPPQDEPTPSDPTDDTPPDENPVQSEKTPVPAWFYDLVEEFYNKFKEKYEKLRDNSEKGEDK